MTRVFEGGATRGSDIDKLDYEGFLSPLVLEQFVRYMHEFRLHDIPQGQELRASDNWQKGIPIDAYMKSLLRHVFATWKLHRSNSPLTPTGEKALLDALCAVLFNAQGYMFELLKRQNVRNDDYQV